MNKIVMLQRPKANKMQLKTLNKVENDLKKEMNKQIAIVSGSFGIALYENWGWRQNRIANLFSEINNAWTEVSNDNYLSMLSLCEKETGIVIGIPEHDGNYNDLRYFQENPSKILDMTIEQRIYMRLRMKKWIGAEMVASVLVALHRRYGFGVERLDRLYHQMEEVRDRYNWDEKLIENECTRITQVMM